MFKAVSEFSTLLDKENRLLESGFLDEFYCHESDFYSEIGHLGCCIPLSTLVAATYMADRRSNRLIPSDSVSRRLLLGRFRSTGRPFGTVCRLTINVCRLFASLSSSFRVLSFVSRRCALYCTIHTVAYITLGHVISSDIIIIIIIIVVLRVLLSCYVMHITRQLIA